MPRARGSQKHCIKIIQRIVLQTEDNNFVHQESKKLWSGMKTIAFENLNIKDMHADILSGNGYRST